MNRVMKTHTASEFSVSMRSLRSSWSYCREDFAAKFAELEEAGMFDENGSSERIWETRNKYVLKVPVGDGKFVVYKSFRRILKPAKFILRPSPCGTEAENYQLMADCGIPVPGIMAAGDIRKGFWLKTAFMVTEFAEGFRDGRDFMPGNAKAEQRELRAEFIRGHLELLARCHNAGMLHRGFTPANLLYKTCGTQMEFMWIDLASCRRRPEFIVNHAAKRDIEQLFSYFDLTEQEKNDFIDFYRQSR